MINQILFKTNALPFGLFHGLRKRSAPDNPPSNQHIPDS
jgi:hypothetical protein